MQNDVLGNSEVAFFFIHPVCCNFVILLSLLDGYFIIRKYNELNHHDRAQININSDKNIKQRFMCSFHTIVYLDRICSQLQLRMISNTYILNIYTSLNSFYMIFFCVGVVYSNNYVTNIIFTWVHNTNTEKNHIETIQTNKQTNFDY